MFVEDSPKCFDSAGDKISRGRRSYPRTPLLGPAAVLTRAHVLQIVPRDEPGFPTRCRGSPKKSRGRSGLAAHAKDKSGKNKCIMSRAYPVKGTENRSEAGWIS